MNNPTISKLIEMGGSEWKAGDKHRIYFNKWAPLAGLEAKFYGSGNVSSATLQGEKISNTFARELVGGKIYYDVVSGEFVAQGFKYDKAALIAIDTLKKAIA